MIERPVYTDIYMDLIHSFLLQNVQTPHSYSSNYSVFLFHLFQFITSKKENVCYKMIDFAGCIS
jgi:hypothetical protein